MPEVKLAPTAYIVLGLLEVYGPGTPYDLKRWADGSIGYFWTVPRAQLYVEPARLAKAGLVEETRESEGRRRRVYRVTKAGRNALRTWLKEGHPGPSEVHDPGLLKLYFSTVSRREDVVALARAQAGAHAKRLATYKGIEPHLKKEPRAAFALATLRFGQMVERAAVEFWQTTAKNPPSVD